MKRVLSQLLVFVTIVFFITAGVTLFIEYKNKESLGEKNNIEIKIENSKILVPEETSIVKTNYIFSKNYFVIRTILSILIPIFILKSSLLEYAEELFNKKIKNNFSQGLIMGIAYSIINFVILFPIAFFSSFYRLKLVGLLNYGFFDWLLDLLKGEMLNLVIFSLFLGISFYIIKNIKRWILSLGVLYVLIMIFGVFIYPVVIDPLINDIKPVSDKALETKIINLAEENGIKNLKVYEIKKSDETSALNAYMTGIFSTKRIVIWDTTLQSLNEDEILSVVAHEIGHYKLNHIPKGMVLEAVLSIITYGSSIILLLMINRKSRRALKGPYGLGYVLLYSTIISMVTSPISLYYSRKIEIEADKFAIEATNDNLTNGILELRFMETNLSPYNVDEWYKILRFDHPTAKERIDLSNSYDYDK
ncbi:M48 family metallopeptidase [Clostridium intestinale]|uniref:Peptidase M48 Ste24p n=1 Tax=Clostridium intestinale URNW TaxID=1294142 RepID=U2PY16_9CLOT|nr:M48 family metallopeptidase [Clostridium intestinale]ERK31375.1 peptidase M48 Ste24p [Clostridium intestinale URNW]